MAERALRKLAGKSTETELDKNENVLLYCNTCKTVVFRGSIKDSRHDKTLIERAIDHIEFSEVEHDLDIVHPKRKTDRIMNFDKMMDLRRIQTLASFYAAQLRSSRFFYKDNDDTDEDGGQSGNEPDL